MKNVNITHKLVKKLSDTACEYFGENDKWHREKVYRLLLEVLNAESENQTTEPDTDTEGGR